jgi:putative ABC transport system ATP-binding protein
MGVILKTENIEKVYGKGELQVHALKPTNLEIEEGIFYAIIGKSGSGKSTLLHILGGLDKPTGGKLFLEGESVFDLKDAELAVLRRRRIGFVFQAFNLLQEHTVMENILMPIHLDNKDPDTEHFNEAIKSLGIEGKLNYYPDELSGGERQRVAIARALVSKPAIVLADEPTGNLDENTGQEVIRLIKESAKKFNQTIVLVTHDLEIAAEADRVITITNGRISSIEDSNTLQHG